MEFIDPDPAIFSDFAALTIDGPIHMLNLVALRKDAKYDDGSAATGREAYEMYSQCAAPFFEAAEGKIAWAGVPQQLLIGPKEESWDISFIAAYPSKDHFLTMIQQPDYQAIIHHRRAAVSTSRLICFEPLSSDGFAP